MTLSPTIPQTTPRSLEVLLEYLRAELACSHCGAAAGTACTWLRRKGLHLARFIDAYRKDLITAAEMALTLVERLNRAAYARYGVATIVWDGFNDGPRPAAGPEPDEAPQLYVVVEVEPGGRRVTVTDPKPRADAARFAELEARSFAGRLEVAPARPEDMADAEGAS